MYIGNQGLYIAYACIFAFIALAIHLLHHLYLFVFTLSIKKAVKHLN